MDGTQKTVYEALENLINKVETGLYGKGDKFDIINFEYDLHDVTSEL